MPLLKNDPKIGANIGAVTGILLTGFRLQDILRVFLTSKKHAYKKNKNL
jgi:hypothetical protein